MTTNDKLPGHATAALDTLEASFDKWLAECGALRAERDALRAKLDALEAGAEKWVVERAARDAELASVRARLQQLEAAAARPAAPAVSVAAARAAARAARVWREPAEPETRAGAADVRVWSESVLRAVEAHVAAGHALPLEGSAGALYKTLNAYNKTFPSSPRKLSYVLAAAGKLGAEAGLRLLRCDKPVRFRFERLAPAGAAEAASAPAASDKKGLRQSEPRTEDQRRRNLVSNEIFELVDAAGTDAARRAFDVWNASFGAAKISHARAFELLTANKLFAAATARATDQFLQNACVTAVMRAMERLGLGRAVLAPGVVQFSNLKVVGS